LLVPITRQIAPFRILRRDQRNLLRSRPAFDLRFGFDGFNGGWKNVVIDQNIHVVLSGKTRDEFLLVLPYAALETVRHTDVKNSGFACEDVHVELTHDVIY